MVAWSVSTFCVCLLIDTVISLKIELILKNETVEYDNTVMYCKYDLEGKTFEYIQWEKDGTRFYEYSRRRVPHKSVLPVAGISLDEEKSNDTHIFLLNLKPESSGEYACSVTTSGGGKIGLRVKSSMITTARQHPLLVATRTNYFLITTKNHTVGSEPRRGIFSVAYHFTGHTIFYGTDDGLIIKNEFEQPEEPPSALPTLAGALILAEEGQVTSMAVDWLRNTLYFTDDSFHTISKINLTSEEKETLLDSTYDGVSNPESIVVDPFQEYLFWGDNNEQDKKIVSSSLDGKTNRETIVSSNLRRAILAIDLERRRLFYISNEGLSSCKYDGSTTRVDFRHHTLDSSVNALSYYDGFMYWSRYNSGKTSRGLFYARITSPQPVVKEVPVKFVLDLKVFRPEMQRSSIQYSCALLECSDGCDIDARGSAQCTCPAGYKLTAGGTVCVRAYDGKNCEKSQTIVNSEPACKGELVFEENFDSNSLNRSKWQNTVRISSDHDLEFVVFDKDKANANIKDGYLTIKPTIFDEDTVFKGTMSLIGCTSPISHLCEKQAFSYNIVPPIKSALINTAHSFNFRYGQITIRAKLPQGDWIYPVLSLQATKDYYNPDYRSGVIHIVNARGNVRLICDGMEEGNQKLMSGVVLGADTNVKKHYIHMLANNPWSDDFHDFKFTWTSDELTFSVDDEPSKNILPQGKTLSEVLGLPRNYEKSRIDPLNKDMYLSMGVSAGGSQEFPDSCTTGSGEAKPWLNNEVKKMLNFWQKKSSWAPGWGQHSALLVDYVRIRAL